MVNIKDFKYKEELTLLKKYCVNKLDEDWITDPQSPFSPSWYKDSLMNAMLELKLSRMEKETNLKLFKTYAFWRYYQFGSILKNHKDRPSCEISVTACIHQTDKWPIHMEGNWIEVEEGDAVIYLGCELSHGRKQFTGDGCAQVFMHYVDAHGKYRHFKDDNEYAKKEWELENGTK